MEPNYDQSPVESKSFSATLPRIELLAPKDQFHSEEALKEWAWRNHKDTILSALIIQYAEEKSAEEEDKEVQKTEEGDNMSLTNDKEEQLVLVERPKPPTKHLDLLAKIAYVQRQFFQSESPKVVFGCLLEALWDLMESEYGFIGEIKYEEDGTMYLQTHAITNIAWDVGSRQFYHGEFYRFNACTSLPMSPIAYILTTPPICIFSDNIHQGLKFYNMKSLFGAVMKTREPIIANNPTKDRRGCGVPEGHPPLDHFLGIPFFKKGGEMIGLVGISNKPGGYSEKDVEFLEPFTVTCSNLIQAYVQIERNDYLINTLEESVQKRTRELELANTDLEEANRRVRRNAVMQLEHFACMSHEIRTPLNCIIGKKSKRWDSRVQEELTYRMITNFGKLSLSRCRHEQSTQRIKDDTHAGRIHEHDRHEWRLTTCDCE